MKPNRLYVVLILAALIMNGCSSRGGERDRSDNAFTVQDSGDWGDATGRVINHLLGTPPPRGGIWPAPDNQ